MVRTCNRDRCFKWQCHEDRSPHSCWDCYRRWLDGQKAGGGTLLLQEQLSHGHPGRLLEKDQEKSWWFIRRHKEDQPSSGINESAGVIRYDNEISEVYHVDIEEKVKEADHVKTNDQTRVPEHLKKEELEIKESLRGSMKNAPLKSSWLAIMMASMLVAGVPRSPDKSLQWTAELRDIS